MIDSIPYDEAIMTFRKKIKPTIKECAEIGDCALVRGDEWEYGNVLKAIAPTDPEFFNPDEEIHVFHPIKTWVFRRIIWLFNQRHYWKRVE